MIHIYNVDNTNFSANGNCILFPSSAVISVKINDYWQSEIVQPLDEESRWKYIKEGAVLKMPSFNGEQLFRIKSVSKTDTEVTATAEPIFMDSMGDCFLVDVRPTKKNRATGIGYHDRAEWQVSWTVQHFHCKHGVLSGQKPDRSHKRG